MRKTTIDNRNTSLDFLRFLGISAIIMAHMDAPPAVFQIRNFDVPMMVLLAGVSYLQYSSKHYTNYFSYLYSRFVRLVIPTWIFLIFYNLFFYFRSDWRPAVDNLLRQFSLVGGSEIGIWILRVLFSMAIIAPLLLKINDRIKNNRVFFAGITITFIAFEVIFYYSRQFLPANIFDAAVLIVFFTVPNAVIFILGIRLPSFSKKTIRNLILIFFAISVICAVILYSQKSEFVQSQEFKNPPQIYYVSYALFVGTALYYVAAFYNIYVDKYKLIRFIGRSTLWIYLWHWFIIRVYEYFNPDFYYLIKYLVIYAVTVLVVYAQTRLIHLLASSDLLGKKQSNFLVKVFTG